MTDLKWYVPDACVDKVASIMYFKDIKRGAYVDERGVSYAEVTIPEPRNLVVLNGYLSVFGRYCSEAGGTRIADPMSLKRFLEEHAKDAYSMRIQAYLEARMAAEFLGAQWVRIRRAIEQLSYWLVDREREHFRWLLEQAEKPIREALELLDHIAIDVLSAIIKSREWDDVKEGERDD